MRIVSYRDEQGTPGVGVLDGDQVAPLALAAPAGVSAMRALLARTGGRLAEAEGLVGDGRLPLASLTLDPVVPDPSKIVAAPVNYRDHQEEMREAAAIDALGVFLKAPSSLIGDGGTVRLPYTDRRFDQEGELAVVVGRRARHVDADDALDVVAGYTVLVDVTMRGGEDRSTRKSFDTFTPLGPWLVTPDEAPAPADMRLRTWVSGDLRQDADVADLIWDVGRLIAYASSVMTLEAGDVVSTGTPAGIGEIAADDDVVVAIDGVGRLTVTVTAAGAVPCPTRGAGRGPTPPASVTPVRRR